MQDQDPFNITGIEATTKTIPLLNNTTLKSYT